MKNIPTITWRTWKNLSFRSPDGRAKESFRKEKGIERICLWCGGIQPLNEKRDLHKKCEMYFMEEQQKC